jgi:hypothetical protein
MLYLSHHDQVAMVEVQKDGWHLLVVFWVRSGILSDEAKTIQSLAST